MSTLITLTDFLHELQQASVVQTNAIASYNALLTSGLPADAITAINEASAIDSAFNDLIMVTIAAMTNLIASGYPDLPLINGISSSVATAIADNISQRSTLMQHAADSIPII